MITLDLNLQYLTDNYNIGAEQLKMYRGKPLQKIMEAEAEKGNSKAADFNLNMYSNPMELVEVFQLMSPENRYEIISNMNYGDKLKLLAMLEKGEMLNGLRFFKKEKLLQMLQNLDDKDKLLAVVMEKYDLAEFMKLIPEREQNKFFDSKNITPEKILAGAKHLEPEQMAKMIENVTGEPQDEKTKDEMMDTLEQMPPQVLKNASKSLEQEEKAFLMFSMAKEDPKVLRELSTEAYMIPLENLQKNDLVDAMGALEEDDIVDMLSELPEDLMAITATQLDPEKFARVLSTDFSDIIAQICAA